MARTRWPPGPVNPWPLAQARQIRPAAPAGAKGWGPADRSLSRQPERRRPIRRSGRDPVPTLRPHQAEAAEAEPEHLPTSSLPIRNSYSWIGIRESRCTEHPYYAQTGRHQVSRFTVISQTRSGLTFGTSRVLRVFSAPTNGGVPTSCQATTAMRTGSGAPSHEPRPSTHAPPSRRRKALSAPARERRSGSWLAQRTSPQPRYLQGHRLLVPRRGHHRAGRARPGPGRGAKSATSPAPPSSSPTSSTATSHEVR